MKKFLLILSLFCFGAGITPAVAQEPFAFTKSVTKKINRRAKELLIELNYYYSKKNSSRPPSPFALDPKSFNRSVSKFKRQFEKVIARKKRNQCKKISLNKGKKKVTRSFLRGVSSNSSSLSKDDSDDSAEQKCATACAYASAVAVATCFAEAYAYCPDGTYAYGYSSATAYGYGLGYACITNCKDIKPPKC